MLRQWPFVLGDDLPLLARRARNDQRVVLAAEQAVRLEHSELVSADGGGVCQQQGGPGDLVCVRARATFRRLVRMPEAAPTQSAVGYASSLLPREHLHQGTLGRCRLAASTKRQTD